MTSNKIPEEGESIARMTEDDVEGHKLVVPSVAGGESIARMTEDDVEGHRAKVPAEGESVARATEDDTEGHRARQAEEGESVAKATEDDVEGHNIGYGSPTLAREAIRAREWDVRREGSRNALIREAKKVTKRKG